MILEKQYNVKERQKKKKINDIWIDNIITNTLELSRKIYNQSVKNSNLVIWEEVKLHSQHACF